MTVDMIEKLLHKGGSLEECIALGYFDEEDADTFKFWLSGHLASLRSALNEARQMRDALEDDIKRYNQIYSTAKVISPDSLAVYQIALGQLMDCEEQILRLQLATRRYNNLAAELAANDNRKKLDSKYRCCCGKLIGKVVSIAGTICPICNTPVHEV
jgi:hypothetical protein